MIDNERARAKKKFNFNRIWFIERFSSLLGEDKIDWKLNWVELEKWKNGNTTFFSVHNLNKINKSFCVDVSMTGCFSPQFICFFSAKIKSENCFTNFVTPNRMNN